MLPRVNSVDLVQPVDFPSALMGLGYAPHYQFANPGGQHCQLFVCSPPATLSRKSVPLTQDHRVVVKILRPGAGDVFRQAILDEFDALGLIDIETGVPWLYEAETSAAEPASIVWDGDPTGEKCPYIVQDFVPGQNLGHYIAGLRERRIAESGGEMIPRGQWVHMSRPLVALLDKMHSHGVLHRDIKPGNIVVVNHFEPWIVDFGAAVHKGRQNRATSLGRTDILGTAAYMGGDRSGTSFDVYAMTVTLGELLTGVNLKDPGRTAQGEAFDRAARAGKSADDGVVAAYLRVVFEERTPQLTVIPLWARSFFSRALQLTNGGASGADLLQLFDEEFPTSQWPEHFRMSDPWDSRSSTAPYPETWVHPTDSRAAVDKGQSLRAKLWYAQVTMATNIEFYRRRARTELIEVAVLVGAVIGVILLAMILVLYVLVNEI